MKIDERIIQYSINQHPNTVAENGGVQAGKGKKADEETAASTLSIGRDAIVHFSEASKEARLIKEVIAGSPDVRAEKVSEIKAKIEAGNYQIDYDAIAGKLADAFTEDLF